MRLVAEIAEKRLEDFSSWYLEEYGADGQIARRHHLNTVPFRVGRGPGADATVEYASVSGRHAELFAHGGRLWVRDLESSNGTYRNGDRITEPVALAEGDILRLSHVELLLGRETGEPPMWSEATIVPPVDLVSPTSHAANASALRELIRARRVTAVFQPIVDFADPDRTAFELLGRGAHETLPDSPAALLEIAAHIGLEVELSNLFCSEGLNDAAALPGDPDLFINIHPAELEKKTLVASLRRARAQHGTCRMVVEIHEAATTDPGTLWMLRTILNNLDMRLAYDDFGAGQARIVELAEVSPDYLKFDICLIHGIDRAPANRRKMLQSLVTMARDLGIACIAEGIETRGELEVCRQIGFEHGQGFLLGRPALAAEWRDRCIERARGERIRPAGSDPPGRFGNFGCRRPDRR